MVVGTLILNEGVVDEVVLLLVPLGLGLDDLGDPLFEGGEESGVVGTAGLPSVKLGGALVGVEFRVLVKERTSPTPVPVTTRTSDIMRLRLALRPSIPTSIFSFRSLIWVELLVVCVLALVLLCIAD